FLSLRPPPPTAILFPYTTLFRSMNKHLIEIQDLPIKPKELAKMIELIENGTISSKIAKKVFAYLVEEGGDPEAYVKEQGLHLLRSEEHTSELQSRFDLVCRLLLE